MNDAVPGLHELLVPLSRLIAFAIEEDLGDNLSDVTTDEVVTPDQRDVARIVLRESAVFCGHAAAYQVTRQLSADASIKIFVAEGQWLDPGTTLAELRGLTGDLLHIERTLLNFVQYLTGIATQTRRFVDILAPHDVKVLDTRKTLPGYRRLAKYAVKIGGGDNHRMGLYDQVMIKDNHIAAAGSVKAAVQRIRSAYGVDQAIIVEVENEEELETAIQLGVDWIMLDNWDLTTLQDAVTRIKSEQSFRGQPITCEVSGGVTLETADVIGPCQPDYVSVGGLTHSVQSTDIGMDY